MKRPLDQLRLSLAVIYSALSIFAQSPTQAPLPQAASQATAPGAGADSTAPDGDRFPALLDRAQQLQAAFVKTETQHMAEVDALLKSRQCQINRVSGLLDRTRSALSEMQEAWVTYYTKWGEVEQRRIDDQRKTLASMETDQQRVKELIDGDSKEHDDLLRRKANLEKTKRTQEIIKDIDDLVEQINDSQTRLDDAKKNYDDASARVNNLQTSIAARVIAMKQNLEAVEAQGLERNSYYEKRRVEAQERCNLKQPTQKANLPPKTAPQ